MGIVEQYLLQLKSEKRRWRRAVAILVVLSLFVATGVSWSLRMTGITIANGATCGQTEHQHTEDCPMEKVLICGYDDEISTEEPTEDATEDATEAPTEEPSEESTEAPTEEPSETPSEEPTEEATEESSTEATEETQEDTVLDAVMNVVADVLSGFVLTADAAEPPAESEHVHTDACYEITWLCELEEHIHVLSCYSDATADIESAVIWEAGLPELTDDWADNLLRVARSQLGRGESERNYTVADDGATRNGITRYGQWYGNPYGDWSSMFVMFCLHYAEIPQNALPRSPGVYNMMRLLQDAQIFLRPDENMGSSGNLLFLDTDKNKNADRIVIVCEYKDKEFTVIGGDWENEVAKVTIPDTDPGILGYVNIRQLQEDWKAREVADSSEPTEPDVTESTDETEPADETEPTDVTESTEETIPDEMSDEPVISLDVEFPKEGILRLVAHIHNIDEAMYTWQWQVSEDGKDW